MKAAKLIFLASPVVVASMLLVANPVKASIVKSATEPRLSLASAAQTDSETVTPDSSEKSNPITDQLGCNCPSCAKARLELQGKLPIHNNL